MLDNMEQELLLKNYVRVCLFSPSRRQSDRGKGERENSSLLHSPSAHNCQDWAGPGQSQRYTTPGRSPGQVEGPRHLICFPSGCMSRQLDLNRSSWDLNSVLMRCKHLK